MSMQFHPVANIFPMMQPDEYKALVEDIRTNGLLEPIWTHEGQIVDGRNRWEACREIGVVPTLRKWSGEGSLVAFVVSLNLSRRHLNSGQRAVVALEVERQLAVEAKANLQAAGQNHGRGQEKPLQRIEKAIEPIHAAQQAAALTGTNRQYVSDAKNLERDAPQLLARVRSAELTIPQAKKELRKEKQQAREHAALALASESQERPWALTDCQEVVSCVALITDPPYGILDESWEPQELESFTREWLKRWNACQADFIVSFWSQAYLFEGRQWFDEELSNYRFQQLLIWHYPNNKKPQSRMGFKQTWEPIYFYRRAGVDRPVGVNGHEWGEGLNDFDCHVAATPQSNFNDVNTKQHPAQKPLSVMRWLVNALTQPGDMVCDPFCGSGTTGIAATQLKRRFHGIELSNEYRELAERRISAYGEL